MIIGKFAFCLLTCFALTAVPATATILTFDIHGTPANGTAIPQTYGDRVSALSDAVGSYGEGNGFTPNVEVDYGFFNGTVEGLNTHRYHFGGYGTLASVIYASNTTAPDYYFIRFVADPGWLVRLNSFDIANFGFFAVSTGLTVVSDLGGVFSETFSVADGNLVTQNYSPMIVGNVVTLQIQGSYFNAALDNINFDQLADTNGPPIPEPSSALLLLGGLAVLAWRRRHIV